MERRFLCDEMLKRLGRWLRAAGYDTAIAENGETDAALLAKAAGEGRLMLSCDRKLAEHRAAQGHLLLLEANSLDAQLHEVVERLSLQWNYRPFSRCLVCNTPIEERLASEVKLPEEVAREQPTVYWCPRCEKAYWEGSHVRRMRRRLMELEAGR